MKKILDLASNIILYFINLPYSDNVLFNVAIKGSSIHVFYLTTSEHLVHLRNDIARSLPLLNDSKDPINVVVRNVTLQEYEQDDMFYSELFSNMTTIKFPHIPNKSKYRLLREKLPPVLPIFSYSGGVGKTTLGLAIAEHIAGDQNKTVLIVDTNFNSPMYLLNRRGIVDWCSHLNEIDRIEEDLFDYVSEIKSNNVYVIAAGRSTNAEVKSEYDFKKELYLTDKDYYLALLSVLRQDPIRFMDLTMDLIQKVSEKIRPDIIIVDCQTGHNEFTEPLLAMCRTGLYISDNTTSNTLYGDHLFDLCYEDVDLILISTPTHNMERDYQELLDNFSNSSKQPDIVMVPYIRIYDWDYRTRRQIVLGSKELHNDTSICELISRKIF